MRSGNMNNTLKWLISIISGGIAAFCGQYGLFIVLVAAAVVLDVVTGLVKAKATGEGLSSEKANRGFWRKMALFVAFAFGIFLDYAAAAVLVHVGVNLGGELPFALIICCYIVLNESISICENLYAINPSIMPGWIVKLLKGGKERIDSREQERETK